MNFPCDRKADCGSPAALRGESAESADALVFFPRLPYVYPNDGVVYTTPTDGGFYPPCASEISQTAADLCAGEGNQ